MRLSARRRGRGGLRLVGRRLPLAASLPLLVLVLCFYPSPVLAWEGTEYASGGSFACSASSGTCASTLGQPDSGASCTGVNLDDWISNQVTGQEWLRVGFDIPLYSSGLRIWEGYAYGHLIGVELIDTDGNHYSVSPGVDDTVCSSEGPVERSLSWPLTAYRVRAVHLVFGLTNQRASVSAVGLVGADQYPTPTPALTSTPGPTSTPSLWLGTPAPVVTPSTAGILSEGGSFLGANWGVISNHPLKIAVPSFWLAPGISLFGVLFVFMAGFALYLFVRLIMQLIP